MAASSLERVQKACDTVGISVPALFELPFPSIVVFAAKHDLCIQELLDVCTAMLRELAALEKHLRHADCARMH